MNLSYWEYKTWLHNIDFAVIGSGIVGLSCALQLKELFPKSKIVIFERGMLPSGASTKNAGFACFGSPSEILEDLKTHSEEEVIALVKKRVDGLSLLRKTLGDKKLAYREYGGYELFANANTELFQECISKIDYLNELLNPVFLKKKAVFTIKKDAFGFKNIQKSLIYNHFEGQLDTGKMMQALLEKVIKKGVFVLNNAEITSFLSKNGKNNLQLNNSYDFSVRKLFIATNGFAKQLMKEDVSPARAQVLITKPIKNLKLKGTFHLEKGYYYFRNIDERVLFGGGRNLDFKAEETDEMGLTSLVQQRLEDVLSTIILPDRPFEIESRWSGIMGIGVQKRPIVKELMENVYCGVRLGGMGVAIGSLVGQELANLGTK